MLFHVDMIYLAKEAKRDVKKALLKDENRNQIESRTGFLQFLCQNEESVKKFCQF